MRITVLVDQFRRYATRLNAPKAQIAKTAVAALLAVFIISQLLAVPSQTVTPPKSIAVIKPGQTSNENYKTIQDNEYGTSSFADRCSKFFEGIQSKESSSDSATDSQEYDTISSLARAFALVPSVDEYLEIKTKEAGKEFKEEMIAIWEKEYVDESANEKARADRFHTFFSNVRIYGACYVETNIFEELTGATGLNLLWGDEVDSGLDETDLFHLSNDFGLKYFSWLSNIMPVYKKMGATIVETGMPEIESTYDAQTVGKASFLYNFRQGLNGKGLIIPVKDDADVNKLLRMAKVLRFIGSSLPIQIIHDGIILEATEKKITEAFTNPITHTDFITLEDAEMLPAGYDVNFSPIENVWFVNIALSMNKKYATRMERNNAFSSLSFLFSSFEQGILVDPSVIPMIKLLSLMDTDQFEDTGSYYFPDRRIDEDLSPEEKRFMNQLFPTEVDEQMFGIPEVNMDKLTQTRMFGEGKTHAINNHVVALNKRDHFLGLLLAVELQLMPITFEHQAIQSDMLFIGPLAAGASKLYIHEVPAATVGAFTEEENRKIKQSVSKEICSQHLGYFDTLTALDDSLIFITNGCRNCEIIDQLDMEKLKGEALYRTLEKNADKIKTWGQATTRFEGAIIPVPQEAVAKNNIDEVERSLQNYGYCGEDIWCAYDVLGAKSDAMYHGDVIEFDEATLTKLNLITKVWEKF